MNKDFKKKWIDALRSGNYKQNYKLANDSYGREINDPRPVGVDVEARCCLNTGAHAILGDRANNMGTLDCFRLLIGNEIDKADIFIRLIEMNDIDKSSFSEIADYIEKNL